MVSAAGDFVYAKFSEINVIIRPGAPNEDIFQNHLT